MTEHIQENEEIEARNVDRSLDLEVELYDLKRTCIVFPEEVIGVKYSKRDNADVIVKVDGSDKYESIGKIKDILLVETIGQCVFLDSKENFPRVGVAQEYIYVVTKVKLYKVKVNIHVQSTIAGAFEVYEALPQK
ncbi:hypothetical protein [Vibrio parahaemolyticus]|uniref:hypothetical protein n=1 Tax=Vibrio parahaemolyticus TaxID=670 RepID=UPI001F18C7E3|nr:hypothetical protein [Vibrio parahaemolyticus]MCG0022171.1 hypothetical protein [Vibrio parahaemolyticus]